MYGYQWISYIFEIHHAFHPIWYLSLIKHVLTCFLIDLIKLLKITTSNSIHRKYKNIQYIAMLGDINWYEMFPMIAFNICYIPSLEPENHTQLETM